MNVRYRVELSQSEHAKLIQLASGGKQPARKLKRAQILLAADAGVSDEHIAASVGAKNGSTVCQTKRRFVEGNLDRALSEEPRPGVGRKLIGGRKPCWCRPPARSPQQAASVGPNCWRAKWSN